MTTRSSRPIVNLRPQTQVSGNAAGSIGNSLVRGGMPWGELGRGVANVAEQQANYEIRTAEQRDVLAVNRALDQASARASARVAELDPMSATYLEDVDTAFREEQEGARGEAQIQFQSSAERLTAAFDAEREKITAKALIARRQELDAQAVSQFTTTTNAALNQILQDPNSFDAVVDETASRALPLLGTLPQRAREELLRDFRDSAVLSLAQGLAEAGQYDEATKILAEQAGEIDPGKITAMRGTVRSIENRKRAEYIRDTTQAFADLEMRVYGLAEGPPASRADIDRAKANGAYYGREMAFISHARIIKARQEAQVAATNVNASLTAAIGSPYAGQRDIDDRWEALVATSLGPDASPEESANLLRQFVRVQRALPKFVQNRLQFAETSTNPDELAAAAQLYTELTDLVPGIKTGLTNGSDVAALAEQMRYSDQPPAQLASAMIGKRRQLPTDAAGLELAWTTDRQLLWNTENPIRADLAAQLGIGEEEVTAGMLGMYEQTTKDIYMMPNGGDRHLARAAAAARVKERFAPSAVAPGGMSPYAPERALPPNLQLELDPQGQADYILGALQAFGEEAGISPGLLPGFTSEEEHEGLPGFALAADPRTQNELRRGERATYPVRIRSDMGYQFINVSDEDRPAAEEKLKNHPRLFLDDRGFLRYRVPGADEAENDPRLPDLAKQKRDRARGVFDRLETWLTKGSQEGIVFAIPDPTREAKEAVGPLVAP